MSSSLTKRFAKAFAAQGFGQLVNILIQVVTVPLFIQVWGQERYGEWLVLYSIPGMLTIADLSFAAAASNAMTFLAGAGERAQAQKVFRSTWILITLISLTVLAVGSLLVSVLPMYEWFRIKNFGRTETHAAMILLIAQIVLGQQGAILSAGYRTGGFYAKGVFCNNLVRLGEFFTLVAVLFSGGGLVQVTAYVLVARAIGYAFNYLNMRKTVDWLSVGWGGFDREVIKPLVVPALTYNAIPLGMALNQNGITFVTNALFGPTAVVVVATIRTLTRLVWQAVTLVTNAVWPEFSRALGQKDYNLARSLHRRCCQLGTWIAIVGALVLLVVGPAIYPRWTSIPLNYAVFYWMLLGIVINSLWSVSYVVSVSINQHAKISLVYLGLTAAGIGLANVFGRIAGLPGIAMSLVGVDVAMVYIAVSASFKILDDQSSGFLSLVKPPFGWVYNKLTRALKRSPAA